MAAFRVHFPRPRAARWSLSIALALGLGCSSPAPGEGPVPATTAAPPSRTAVTTPPSTSAAGPADVVPTGYRMPSADVVEIVDAPPTPDVDVSPDGERLGLYTYEALPSIELVTRPFERLAGLRIDAERHARRRTRWTTAVTLLTIADGKRTEVALPEGSHITNPVWSPDGQHLAFTRDGAQGLELWVVAAADGQARRLGTVRPTDVLGSPLTWMPGSASLLVREVPPELGPAPERPRVPPGPTVEDTAGKAATNRTYQDLLSNAVDEALFEHFATTRLAIVDLEGGVRPLGDPGLYASAEPSPDGKYVLAERLRRPFSYTVPYYRFARVVEVLDPKAKVVRRVADQDVADEVPIEGVRTGPRDVHWQPGHPATLVWTEALDEGDPRKPADHRDRLMTHAAPFADTPEERLRVQHRLSDVSWTDVSGQVLVTEYDRDRRWNTTRLHQIDQAGTEPRVLFDRSARDAYGHPGWPVRHTLADGTRVVIVDDGHIFLSGEGASPEGDRPFLDRYDLATGATSRLMQSEGNAHQELVDFAGPGHDSFVVRRESAESPPNFFLLGPGGDRQLTELPDPHPQLTGIRKQILSYTRRDGVPLSGTLYLPPSYEEGQRLPLVIWAYPLEYNDGDTAGQVRAAPRTFTRLEGTSALMFLTQGYAVLGNAAMPIVGDPETMNDSFLDQVVWSAEAAIDAAVAAGVADRDRVGIAGHSYGAFMTANLLAHSDLFRAGIARSGAYNRTLTPFGYQSERRTLWEAPQTYVKVSPLMSADRIDEPLLLIHGEVDNNAGTHPLQSNRLFRAMEGTGGTARLVMLPGEAHGYVARESVLHVLAESFEWFDEHVKNAEPRTAKPKPTATVTDTTGPEPKSSATRPPDKTDPEPTTDPGKGEPPQGEAKAPSKPEPKTPAAPPPSGAAQPAPPPKPDPPAAAPPGS